MDSSARHGVDPLLIYSIMHQESTFKQRAVSHKGARGLMQLMPGTAARFGVRNIFDPRENIEGGTRYVRWLLDRFRGDVRLALAGYNAGEGAVDKYGWRVPPYSETQNYVRRIFARYSLIRDPQSARLAPEGHGGIASCESEKRASSIRRASRRAPARRQAASEPVGAPARAACATEEGTRPKCLRPFSIPGRRHAL